MSSFRRKLMMEKKGVEPEPEIVIYESASNISRPRVGSTSPTFPCPAETQKYLVTGNILHFEFDYVYEIISETTAGSGVCFTVRYDNFANNTPLFINVDRPLPVGATGSGHISNNIRAYRNATQFNLIRGQILNPDTTGGEVKITFTNIRVTLGTKPSNAYAEFDTTDDARLQTAFIYSSCENGKTYHIEFDWSYTDIDHSVSDNRQWFVAANYAFFHNNGIYKIRAVGSNVKTNSGHYSGNLTTVTTTNNAPIAHIDVVGLKGAASITNLTMEYVWTLTTIPDVCLNKKGVIESNAEAVLVVVKLNDIRSITFSDNVDYQMSNTRDVINDEYYSNVGDTIPGTLTTHTPNKVWDTSSNKNGYLYVTFKKTTWETIGGEFIKSFTK